MKKKTVRNIIYLVASITIIITGAINLPDNGSTNSNDKKNENTEKVINVKNSELANLKYEDVKEVTVNNNNPNFSTADLTTDKGSWQSYSNLDNLNRAGAANALLNKEMMPTAKREGLTWNPTGWHNKRIKGGWLYNRSHLIGYQLSGQNNNPKNLITGTRQLNSPEMLAHEMDIAYFLKNNPNKFVRYRVTPIFRGNELLARGVQMEAQSSGSDDIKFNVYIFNVQDNVNINYADGTSVVDNS
ncbi:DNA/RNA non-specific endonuclease [Lactobacillus sp. YT155]|uniref:DNA/RNA non-specific endonuclease n=1 Tax=Lactobacillus sp. YT155 TaxID=3060955 RepID=UPI00265F71BD|nr:DNA/RNA non-specific endonuclease [Lactobacillus sp. YT155]MDO1605032.1 DNA/RNA non-specific endonuclease [Lactobacillus sp. YT155]